MEKPLRLKDISAELQIGRETLRFYERTGLIPIPKRSESGYREYTSDTLNRLKFIKMAQQAGFTLREIKSWLNENKKKKATKSQLVEIYNSKINTIDEKINILLSMKKTLENLKRKANQTDCVNIICPIFGKIKIEDDSINKLKNK